MTVYLTWNVFHGEISSPPPSVEPLPAGRIRQIVQVGMTHAVDVICLQEVPRDLLDPAVALGAPGEAAPFAEYLDETAPGWADYYGVVQVYSQGNPEHHSTANSPDGYLVFYRRGSFRRCANPRYYHPDAFQDLIGNYLRPPVAVDLQLADGTRVTVLNWHADLGGPQVACAVTALDRLLGTAGAQPHPVVVCGDFNYAGALNNVLTGLGRPPFRGWDDLSVYLTDAHGNAFANGVDHILTSGTARFVLNNVLTFKSNAYHYPFAVRM